MQFVYSYIYCKVFFCFNSRARSYKHGHMGMLGEKYVSTNTWAFFLKKNINFVDVWKYTNNLFTHYI